MEKEYQINWKMWNPMESQYGKFNEVESHSRWQSKEWTERQLTGLRSMEDLDHLNVNRIWDITVKEKESVEKECHDFDEVEE